MNAVMVSSFWKCINCVSYWGWVVTEPGKLDSTSQQNKRTWQNTHTRWHLTLTRDVSCCRLWDWESVQTSLLYRQIPNWLIHFQELDSTTFRNWSIQKIWTFQERLPLSFERVSVVITVTLGPILFFILPDGFVALIFYSKVNWGN